jgi:hypothetical protein
MLSLSIRRIFVFIFVCYISLVYPISNRVNTGSALDRICLIVLVVIIVSIQKRTLTRSLSRLDSCTNASVFAYMVYISISMLSSILFGIQSPRSLLTYSLNSIAPLVMYFCFVGFDDREFLIKSIFFVTGIDILIGISTYKMLGFQVPFVTDFFSDLVFKGGGYRLVSLAGKSTVIGYMSLFCFSYTIFFRFGKSRYFLLILYGIATILSMQRSMWAGLLLAFAIYFMNSKAGQKKKKHDFLYFAILISAAFLVLAGNDILEPLTKLVSNRLLEFNIGDAMSERSSQQLIFNVENPLSIVFGEGYGKYSPLNKEENLINLPDAPLYMIYNETGILGLSIFILMIASFGLRAFGERDWFQVWLVLHLVIALSGSRVLWYFPLNFLIFMLLGSFQKERGVLAKKRYIRDHSLRITGVGDNI